MRGLQYRLSLNQPWFSYIVFRQKTCSSRVGPTPSAFTSK